MSKSIRLFIYNINSEGLILLGEDSAFIGNIENIKPDNNGLEK